MSPPPMPQGCPWGGFTPPNVDWCEAELCSWITNPANTWSNLAYLILGLIMWRQGRARGGGTLALFGPASVAVGLCSFVYHASYTFFFQFFDFVGMFIFAVLVVTVNFRRMGVITPRQQLPAYLIGVAVFSGLVPPLFYVGIPIQPLVGILIVISIVQEARLWRTGRHGLYVAALGLLTAAAVCSALDLSRAWCDPDNHWLQGHAAWHVLSAGCLYVLFLFYAQLERGGPAQPATTGDGGTGLR